MSKSFKYVKEFEFPSHAGYSGSAGQTMVKGYARGGMLKDNSTLGIKGNKNPGETKMHTAPNLPGPKMAMKAGGPVIPKAGYKKIDKVMGEYKRGTLHSGSKTGPKVTNPKQAVAIAMSEARRADKKKK